MMETAGEIEASGPISSSGANGSSSSSSFPNIGQWKKERKKIFMPAERIVERERETSGAYQDEGGHTHKKPRRRARRDAKVQRRRRRRGLR